MLDGLDVLVVDLQDVGTRIYTFIYTMAYCLTGAAKAGIPVIVCDRPNPIGGVGGRRADARARLRVVRRALPDPDAARPDHRRAGPPVQRHLRAGRRPDRRADERLVARGVLGRHRRALGDAVAQHADAGHRHRLPRPGALRGHDAVRGARHHPAVRAVRRAGARPERAGLGAERLPAARRAVPAGHASSRRSTSTRRRPATASRSTSPTAAPSSRSWRRRPYCTRCAR